MMASKIMFGALGLLIVAVAFSVAPDLRRYLRMRAM
jgi:hypothetical protein